MKKLLLFFALLLAVRLNGQSSTTVTGTITDADGIVWVNGTYTFNFVGASSVTWPGGTVPRTITGSLDGTGSFSQSVPNNNTINPSPSSWTFVVCPAPGITNASSSCSTTTNIFVTGTTQALSVTPVGLDIAPGPGNVAYATSEVTPTPLGSQIVIYNSSLQVCTAATGNTCTTWSAAGGGGTWASITGKPGECPIGTFVVNVSSGTCAPPFQPVLSQLFSYGCTPTSNPVPDPPWVVATAVGGTASFQATVEGGVFAECEAIDTAANAVPFAYASTWTVPNDQYASSVLDHIGSAGTQVPGNPDFWCIISRSQPNPGGGPGYAFCSTMNEDGSGTVSLGMFFGPGDNTTITLNPRYTPNFGTAGTGDQYESIALGSNFYAVLNGAILGTAIDGTYTSGTAGIFAGLFATGGTTSDIQWQTITAGSATTGVGTFSSVTSGKYLTASNCNVNSVSPAACGSAAAGVFVVPTTTTSYTVNTTAVTTNSRIFIVPRTDNTGITGSPTCATPVAFTTIESARVNGTSFTITLASTTGTTCWSYWIVN